MNHTTRFPVFYYTKCIESYNNDDKKAMSIAIKHSIQTQLKLINY